MATQSTNTCCFLQGTTILCSVNSVDTWVAIENITNGTLVKTVKSGYLPVVAIGTTSIYNPAHSLRGKDRLYKYTSTQYPSITQDLYLTGSHSVLVSSLTNDQKNNILKLFERVLTTDGFYHLDAYLDEKSQPYTSAGDYVVWNLALQNSSDFTTYGIYANGLLVETMSIFALTQHSNLVLQ